MKIIYYKLIYGFLLIITSTSALATNLYYQNGPRSSPSVRPYIVPYGSVSYSDIDWAATLLNKSSNMGSKAMAAFAGARSDWFWFWSYNLTNQWCPVGTNFSCVGPSSSCTADELLTAQNQSVAWINSIISQNPHLGNDTFNDVKANRVTESLWECRDRTAPYNWVRFKISIPAEVVPEIPSDKSVCSLGSDINFNFSSTVLDVSGVSSTQTLPITCTSGDAQNYQLKLTGSNATNGRLNFGNGVSAEVSLNGTQVQANGSGISLNKLTSGSIPVSATLAGTASGSGVTNANGVLILDAL